MSLSGPFRIFSETLFRVTLPTLKSRETPDARLPTPAIVENNYKKMASRETSYWRIVRGGDCHKQSICGFTFFLTATKEKQMTTSMIT